MNNLVNLLNESGIKSNVTRLIITCIDPNYPVSSLGYGFEDIDVSYTPSNHELGGHVQIAGKGFKQVFLRHKTPDGYETIEQDKVHESLGDGVIQLAYREVDGTIVMGIAGDAYAFHPSGAGFAFANPGHISAEHSNDLLSTMIQYAEEIKSVFVMTHPDCGLYANNVGSHQEPQISQAQLLEIDGSNYMNSSYNVTEHDEKRVAVENIKEIAYGLGVREVKSITPKYQKRTPGVLKALES